MSTDPILGPNDHIRKGGVIRQSRLRLISNTLFKSLGFSVKTSKPRQTRARLGNVELADETELVNLAVG